MRINTIAPRRRVHRLVGSLSIALALVVAACGGGETATTAPLPSPSPAPAPAPVPDDRPANVTFGTGPDGGVYAVVGAGMSQLINDHVSGVRSSTQTTAASLENTRLVRDGEITMGLSDNLTATLGVRGEGPFEGEPKADNLAFIVSGYPALGHQVVRADSDIRDLGDMKGRSVCVAPGVQGPMLNEILSMWDLSLDDLDVTVDQYSACAQAVIRGQIDLFNYNGGGSSSIIYELQALGQVRFLSTTDERIAKLQQTYPWWLTEEIPADMYEAQGLPAKTVATSTGLIIASRDLSESFVYDFVKAMHENFLQLEPLHPNMKFYQFPSASVNPMSEDDLPTHPGALRYFREMGWR
jgi:TRAP transporter TAXI family solute receptor